MTITTQDRARKTWHTTSNLHVSCSSDSYKSGHDYVGICLWTYDGKADFRLNGMHCKQGYIVVADSAEVLKKFPNEAGQVHGACFRHFFGQSYNANVVTASGFAFRNGGFRFNSGTCNRDHVAMKGMADQVRAAIERAVRNYWFSNGQQNTSC